MTSRNPRDPMLPFGSDQCQCPTCKLYFNSTYAFDKHRYGPYTADESTRHCLTLLEMRSSGWTQGRRGHWRSPRRGLGPAAAQRREEA